MYFHGKINNILVTGAGGDIGIAVSRILRSTNEIQKIIGTDISDDNAASHYCDEFLLIPKFNNKNYFIKLKEIITRKKIDLIIPTSEEEIRGWFSSGIRHEFSGVPLIIANENSLHVGFDKLETSIFLKSNNMFYPWTVDATISKPLSFPCILKSRSGSGSKDVYLVNQNDFTYFSSKFRDNYIWQEFIDGYDHEYTCGLYRTVDKRVRTIIFRRKLKGEETGSGIVVENKSINDLLYKIAYKLKLQGSINVQLRVSQDNPIVFEINPRFSSTVMFRHILGFKDLIWSIQEAIRIAPEQYSQKNIGKKIYRVSNEIIL